MSLYRLKYNDEVWFEKKTCVRYENIAWVSLHIHDQVMIFILNCSAGYFFFHIHKELFPLFLLGVLYIWFYYALWFQFDPETGTESPQRILLFLFSRHSWSRYTLSFPDLFQDLQMCRIYNRGF